MSASLTDILTTQKNGVVAINGLNQTFSSILTQLTSLTGRLVLSVPQYSSATILASQTTLIVAGSGICHAISIPVFSGANQVLIYDSATTGGIASTNLLYASLPSSTTGFKPFETITMPYANGIVVVTGTSMNAVVSYTPS